MAARGPRTGSTITIYGRSGAPYGVDHNYIWPFGGPVRVDLMSEHSSHAPAYVCAHVAAHVCIMYVHVSVRVSVPHVRTHARAHVHAHADTHVCTQEKLYAYRYIVMALYTYGLYSYGLHSYGPI